MTQISKSRIEYFDIAKGIGFCLVVLAHNAPLYVDSWIIPFYMPLFFVVSGYFFKPTEDNILFIKKRVNGLIKPYYIFAMISLIMFVIFKCNGNMIIHFDSVLKKMFTLLVAHNGVGLYPYKVNLSSTGPAYFIMQMFITSVFCKIISYMYSRIGFIKIFIVTIIVIVFSFLSQTYMILPFKTQQAILVIGFYYYGYLLKFMNIDFKINYLNKKNYVKYDGNINKTIFTILLIFLGVIFLLYEHKNGLYISNYQGKYSDTGLLSFNGLIVYIGACFISTTVIFLSKLACYIPFVKIFFKFIGENTIYLLIIHTLERQYIKFTFFLNLVKALPNKYIYIVIFKLFVFIMVLLIFKLLLVLYNKIKMHTHKEIC